MYICVVYIPGMPLLCARVEAVGYNGNIVCCVERKTQGRVCVSVHTHRHAYPLVAKLISTRESREFVRRKRSLRHSKREELSSDVDISRYIRKFESLDGC